MTESASSLSGLVVVDLGLGMAPALVAKFLREAGAAITRVEPPAGDPFYSVYPAYEVWHRGSLKDESAGQSAAQLDAVLARADVCIVGGEDFPGLPPRRDAAALQQRFTRLVVLNVEGYPAGTKHAARPATDILVQARSGLAFEHYSKRPLLMGFEPANYGAALHGLCGLFAALTQRESTGRGQVVSVSLLEGALSWILLLWCNASKATPAANFVMPKDPSPLIFKCMDGVYVQVLLGSTGSKYLLYKILGINDPSILPNDSGMPQPGGEPKNFFGDVDLLAKHVERRHSGELLAAIAAAGLPAEPVLQPGGCWDDPQVQHNNIVVREADGLRHIGHPIATRGSPAPRKPLQPNAKAPLSGMKVVDFGAFVAGPYSSALMADLGADVIKVEATVGDPNRSIFRSYASVNRGKRVISIDLKNPQGLKIAQQLCMAADVVTNNFRPGVSARLGIDARTLHAMKPELIVLESAAYGTTGPRAQGAGFDMCFQALCGHDWRAGGAGNPPLWNRTSMVDFAAGIIGAVGALQSVYQRARTGAGAEIGAGLLNAGLYLMSELVQNADGQFVGAPQVNHTQTGYHPAEQFYETADGWIAIAARDEAMAKRLVAALQLGKLINLPRQAWNDDTAATLAAAIKIWNLTDLLAALLAANVWAEACCQNGESEYLGDPDLLNLGTVYRSEHPQFGTVRQIGPLVRLSGAERPAARHAPVAGEHTEVVLTELGYTPENIKGLRERQVIK
jgi:crotonobetainyl-CoA:carnitine CoA-transferase CaiB-like acyl-CoA transferase